MENKILDRSEARWLSAEQRCLFIPDGFTRIENEAFRYRRGFDKVVFPNTLVSIGTHAFTSSYLKEVSLPKNLRNMGMAPFCFCKQLENISVSPDNTCYKAVNGVLYDYNLTTLVQYPAGKKDAIFIFPDSVKSISPKAFSGCKYLKKVVLPDDMKVINRRAFSACYGLEEIILPHKLEFIGEKAFAYCQSLREVFVPPLCFVEKDAFLDCDSVAISLTLPQAPVKYTFKIKQYEKASPYIANQIYLPTNSEHTNNLTTEQPYTISILCEEKQVIKKDIDISTVIDESNLDDNGIVKIGTQVVYGDVLVKKAKPKPESNLSAEERLLRAIFGERTTSYENASLTVPFGVEGVVTEIMVNREPYINNAIIEQDIVSITIMQTFPIGIGDVLSDDDGNKGIVVGFDDSLPSDTIRTNFHLESSISKNLLAKKDLCARTVGEYNIWDYPIATRYQCGDIAYTMSKVPQRLTTDDIFRFINNGYGDILQNILLFQACEPENRMVIRSNKEGVSNYYLPKSSINAVISLLLSLCIKPVFRDENGNELHFSYTKNNVEFIKALQKKITLELECLVDEDIQRMSYGEVTNDGTLNSRTHSPEPNGLLCEKIFGTTRDYKCRCGKYKGEKSLEKVCEKCGVEVEKSNVRYERMGHIKLANVAPHPFSETETISLFPILPADLRPVYITSSRKFMSHELNELYRRMVSRNNRLKKVIELNAPEISVKNEKRFFSENLESIIDNRHGLIGYHDRKLCALTDKLGYTLKDIFDVKPLDFSASCAVTIDDSLAKSSCGLPLKLAIELFKPIILRSLCREKAVENLNAAKLYLKEILHNGNNDISMKIETINKILSNYKIIIYAKESEGEILFVTPIITTNCVLSLTNEQFASLSLKVGERATIILPITNTAQKMICDIQENGVPYRYNIEAEKETDFLKELYEASMSNENLTVVLKNLIDNHCVCKFDTMFSRMLIGKPSSWAWKFYNVPTEEYETIVESDENVFDD